MFEILDKLIRIIQSEYEKNISAWEKSENYQKVNLRKKTINELAKTNELLPLVFSYRLFINQTINTFSIELQNNDFGECKVNTRIKAQNSIEYKLINYKQNHENGNIAINKCFNDIYGMRIILQSYISHEKIRQWVKENYVDLKCIASAKNNYIATHVYFKKDNFSFPWELQIWNKKDEEKNILSHKMYKQDYIKWENTNKGGEKNGETFCHHE